MDVATFHPYAVDVTNSDVASDRYYRLAGGFTPLPHDLMEEAGAHLNAGAFRVLYRIVRHILGWQRESATLSRDQLVCETHLSERGVVYAIRELEALNVIEVARPHGGRGAVSEYRLLAPSQWKLPETEEKGATIAPITQMREKGAVSAPISREKGATIAPIQAKKGAKYSRSTYKKEIHINKLSKEITAGAVDAPTPKPRAKRERKTSDDEQVYIKRVFELVKPHRRMPDAAKREAEVSAIRRMYKLEPRPTPEQIAEFYSLEITRPAWDARGLHINHLESGLGAYLKAPSGYKARIARERKGANGGYDRTPPPTPSPRPAAPLTGVAPIKRSYDTSHGGV